MVIMSEETMRDMVNADDTNDTYQASCRKCGKVVTMDSFKDRLSLRMYNLGGHCQGCQDLLFDENDEMI